MMSNLSMAVATRRLSGWSLSSEVSPGSLACLGASVERGRLRRGKGKWSRRKHGSFACSLEPLFLPREKRELKDDQGQTIIVCRNRQLSLPSDAEAACLELRRPNLEAPAFRLAWNEPLSRSLSLTLHPPLVSGTGPSYSFSRRLHACGLLHLSDGLEHRRCHQACRLQVVNDDVMPHVVQGRPHTVRSGCAGPRHQGGSGGISNKCIVGKLTTTTSATGRKECQLCRRPVLNSASPQVVRYPSIATNFRRLTKYTWQVELDESSEAPDVHHPVWLGSPVVPQREPAGGTGVLGHVPRGAAREFVSDIGLKKVLCMTDLWI